MNTRIAKRAAGGLGLLMACATARGQEGVDHLQRNLQQIQLDTQAQVDRDLPPDRRALIDYGGYLTFSYLGADDAAHDNHAFRGYELVGYGRLNLDDANEFYARGRADYRDYNPGDSFDGEPSHLQGGSRRLGTASTCGGTKPRTQGKSAPVRRRRSRAAGSSSPGATG